MPLYDQSKTGKYVTQEWFKTYPPLDQRYDFIYQCIIRFRKKGFCGPSSPHWGPRIHSYRVQAYHNEKGNSLTEQKALDCLFTTIKEAHNFNWEDYQAWNIETYKWELA